MSDALAGRRGLTSPARDTLEQRNSTTDRQRALTEWNAQWSPIIKALGREQSMLTGPEPARSSNAPPCHAWDTMRERRALCESLIHTWRRLRSFLR